MQFPPEAWLRMSLNHGSITWISVLPSGRVILRTLGDTGHMSPDVITSTWCIWTETSVSVELRVLKAQHNVMWKLSSSYICLYVFEYYHWQTTMAGGLIWLEVGSYSWADWWHIACNEYIYSPQGPSLVLNIMYFTDMNDWIIKVL